MLSNEDIQIQMQYLTDALHRLWEAITANDGSDIYSDSIIQRFEFSVELVWKTLKKVIMTKTGDENVLSPKDAIRKAQSYGIITNADFRFDCLDARNELSHMYNAEMAKTQLEFIITNYDTCKHIIDDLSIYLSDAKKG